MKFYKALGMLIESKINEGCSELFIINENWNGLKTGKDMKVQVRHQQEDPMYNMSPFLEMTIAVEGEGVDCLPWIPSFLDMFSDKWIVKKYNVETKKEEIVEEI